jgi:hypothetical protein
MAFAGRVTNGHAMRKTLADMAAQARGQAQ